MSFMTTDSFEKGEDEPGGRVAGREGWRSVGRPDGVADVFDGRGCLLTIKRIPTPNPLNNSSTSSSLSIDDESELGRYPESLGHHRHLRMSNLIGVCSTTW